MAIANTDLITKPGGIKIFFRRGTSGGFRDLGNIVEASITSELDTLEHFTSRSGTRAKDKEFILTKSMALEFSLDWASAANFQLAFLGGELSDVAAGAVTVSNELITLNGTTPAALALPPAATPNAVVTSADGQTTYDAPDAAAVPPVVGDYILSVAERTLARTVASTIADGEEVSVTYDWDAPRHSQFAVYAKGIIRGASRLILWPSAGARVVWEIPSCELRPAGEIELNDEEVLALPVQLSVLDASDTHPTTPFGTMRHYIQTEQ